MDKRLPPRLSPTPALAIPVVGEVREGGRVHFFEHGPRAFVMAPEIALVPRPGRRLF